MIATSVYIDGYDIFGCVKQEVSHLKQHGDIEIQVKQVNKESQAAEPTITLSKKVFHQNYTFLIILLVNTPKFLSSCDV